MLGARRSRGAASTSGSDTTGHRGIAARTQRLTPLTSAGVKRRVRLRDCEAVVFRRSVLLATAAALVLWVTAVPFGWSGILDSAHAGTMAASAMNAEETDEDRVNRCEDPFEMISDPGCLRALSGANKISLEEGLDLIDAFKNPGTCITRAASLGLDPGRALTACAAREAAILAANDAERKAKADGLADPNSVIGRDVPGLDTAEGCGAFAREQLGLPDADANFACSMRLSRIAEQKANEALEQIRRIREESERKANRQACEDIAKKVIEMSDAMYTPKWNQLGGDAEWKKLETEFLERKCQEVLR
jgi:hypothetical protein